MIQKKEINTIEDIRLLVDEFYGKVRKDKLLKDIFEDRIQNRWPEHLDKMYRFWQTVLLEEHTYHGSPFVPHATMPVELEHFERWVKLFFETLDEFFIGENVMKAKLQGSRMATMFNSKIQFYKENTTQAIL